MLSSHQLAEITGVSYRRIDYWCRVGILFPDHDADGSGSRRGWDRTHIKVVMAIDELMQFAARGTMRKREFTSAMLDLESRRRSSWTGETLTLGSSDFTNLVIDLGAIERAAYDAFAGRLVRAS